LPINLQILNCSDNQIKNLDNLPANLRILDCAYNYNLRNVVIPSTLSCIEYQHCEDLNVSKMKREKSNDVKSYFTKNVDIDEGLVSSYIGIDIGIIGDVKYLINIDEGFLDGIH
jgi:hypothetical protein